MQGSLSPVDLAAACPSNIGQDGRSFDSSIDCSSYQGIKLFSHVSLKLLHSVLQTCIFLCEAFYFGVTVRYVYSVSPNLEISFTFMTTLYCWIPLIASAKFMGPWSLNSRVRSWSQIASISSAVVLSSNCSPSKCESAILTSLMTRFPNLFISCPGLSFKFLSHLLASPLESCNLVNSCTQSIAAPCRANFRCRFLSSSSH